MTPSGSISGTASSESSGRPTSRSSGAPTYGGRDGRGGDTEAILVRRGDGKCQWVALNAVHVIRADVVKTLHEQVVDWEKAIGDIRRLLALAEEHGLADPSNRDNC